MAPVDPMANLGEAETSTSLVLRPSRTITLPLIVAQQHRPRRSPPAELDYQPSSPKIEPIEVDEEAVTGMEITEIAPHDVEPVVQEPAALGGSQFEPAAVGGSQLAPPPLKPAYYLPEGSRPHQALPCPRIEVTEVNESLLSVLL